MPDRHAAEHEVKCGSGGCRHRALWTIRVFTWRHELYCRPQQSCRLHLESAKKLIAQRTTYGLTYLEVTPLHDEFDQRPKRKTRPKDPPGAIIT